MAALVITSIDTGEEIKRVDVTGKHTRQIERIEMGMLINLDHEKYYVRRED